MAARRPRVLVKHGRHGIELRVDGTLASLHRPGSARTGVVWWALAAPLLLLRRQRRRRVLLLGLGGGSVARAVRALDPAAELVGVELDPEVLRMARRHLDLDSLRVEVVRADALHYLERERRQFDLVVEDLFVGPLRTVHKPAGLLEHGYPAIGRRLRAGGIVVSNTIHETPRVKRAMRALGGRIVVLGVQGHWNHVLMCGHDLPDPREVRRRLGADASLAQVLPHLTVRAR